MDAYIVNNLRIIIKKTFKELDFIILSDTNVDMIFNIINIDVSDRMNNDQIQCVLYSMANVVALLLSNCPEEFVLSYFTLLLNIYNSNSIFLKDMVLCSVGGLMSRLK